MHISSTHPKALSVSGSFFIAKETFIHVGAIFLRDSYHFCKIKLKKVVKNQEYPQVFNLHTPSFDFNYNYF